ncbi:unnamed protein product [Taenia asiatica]|uniref:DUF1904 family protein n=1 Tax=Taenia asiatica TaxID=60517 RepID=A0A0R3VY46_TAEAS|nr:unnamed protein product [Taenia asiatica]
MDNLNLSEIGREAEALDGVWRMPCVLLIERITADSTALVRALIDESIESIRPPVVRSIYVCYLDRPMMTRAS